MVDVVCGVVKQITKNSRRFKHDLKTREDR